MKRSWLVSFTNNARPRICLICIPPAGAGSTFFQDWGRYLPKDVELKVVSLPGRDSGIYETALTNIEEAVSRLSHMILNEANCCPIILLGHSMGALIAFELAKVIQTSSKDLLCSLVVAGKQPPQLDNEVKPTKELSDAEFIAVLRKFNGLPEYFFQDKELLETFLPIFRSDFALLESYNYKKSEPLNCNIFVFAGLHDLTVDYKKVSAWDIHTTALTQVYLFSGDHFFIKSQQKEFMEKLNYIIAAKI